MDRQVRTNVLSQHYGIQIADINDNPVDDEEFVRVIRDALELIRTHDRRRWNTVRREVRYVTNRELIQRGRYMRYSRSFEIDFPRFYDGTPEYRTWQVSCIASAIVHEATHGRLFSHGIPYVEKNLIQVEHLCHREEVRFASRLPKDEFDLEAYKRDNLPTEEAVRWRKGMTPRRLWRLIRERSEWSSEAARRGVISFSDEARDTGNNAESS